MIQIKKLEQHKTQMFVLVMVCKDLLNLQLSN